MTVNATSYHSASAASWLAGHAPQPIGQLHCFDRVIVQGTLVDVAHPGALAVQMHAAGFKPRDLPRFAQRFTQEVCDHAVILARQHGLQIEYIQKQNFRKEDRIADILKKRGAHPGLVHVFSAKETATVFDTRHPKPDGHAQLIARRGACLHYYFYWMHQELGLIYVRVATWLPLRVQIYFNGHSWLGRQLEKAGVAFEMTDNALGACADWPRAQALADSLDARTLHEQLAALGRECCPASAHFQSGYHWSFMQVEYAQDLVWAEARVAEGLFEELARQALLSIRADDVARFLGRKVPLAHDTPLESHLGRRYQGLRLKHRLGPASVKLYNKPGGILRLEATTYDVSFFKHYREVEHRDGSKENTVAVMKKNIYSLRDLAGVMRASVQRYGQWLGALNQHSAGRRELDRLGQSQRDEAGRSHRGFNLFLRADAQALQSVMRGEFAWAGITARRVRAVLDWSRGRVSRLLKRLRVHGLLKKIGRSYTYYVTTSGQRIVAAALHFKEQVVLPHLHPAVAPPGKLQPS